MCNVHGVEFDGWFRDQTGHYETYKGEKYDMCEYCYYEHVYESEMSESEDDN